MSGSSRAVAILTRGRQLRQNERDRHPAVGGARLREADVTRNFGEWAEYRG